MSYALRPDWEPAPHPFEPDAGPPPLPHNLEAEQALLGALMFENEWVHRMPAGLRGSLFYEPFHQRLYDAILDNVNAGYLAEPTVLVEEFRGDPAFREFGGLRYLADLVDRAPPGSNSPEYARVIIDLGMRREIMRQAMDMYRRAGDTGPGAPDAKGLITAIESDLIGMQVDNRVGELQSLQEGIRGTIAYVQDRTSHTGIETGLRPLDLQLGPMLPGDLLLLAGRPSMGKSAVGLSAALNVAAPGLAALLNGRDPDEFGIPPAAGVIQVHGEMTFGSETEGGQTVRRHMTDVGYHLYGTEFPKYSDIRKKNVSADQVEMMRRVEQTLADVPIRGIKRTGATISTIRSLVRRQASDWKRAGIKTGLLLVDHVGLLRSDGENRGRYDSQTEIAIAMKEIAGELGIPVLALVQLNRNVEQRDDKRPMLSDLRESGAWEENADVVMMAYRDAYYAQREPEPDVTKNSGMDWAKWDGRRKSKQVEILLPKVREGDAGGSAMLWADLAWNAIRGMEPDKMGGLI